MSIRSFKRAHARRLARERRRLANVKRRSALVAGATLTASALMVSTADAATFTVTTNGDGAGSCSGGPPAFSCDTLRAAVTNANASGDASNTINFAAALPSPITVATPLTITGNHALAIDGPGATTLAVSGGTSSQMFQITAPTTASVSISGLTLKDGSASAPGGAIEATGSAAAPLTLTNDTISGSKTTGTVGGGAVYDHGSLTITGSTITGNTAASGIGGGIDIPPSTTSGNKYDLTVAGSTISGNTALSGGGIAGSNNLVIGASHITGNHATSAGLSNGAGGGIYRSPYSTLESTTAIGNSTITGNTATHDGGGILAASKYGTTISGSTISGNASTRGGGLEILGVAGYPHHFGKYNPTHLINTTISGNTATMGAGINVATALAGNSVKIESSTISANHGGASSFGGGLLVSKYDIAPIDVSNSTISGNTATHGGGASLSYGGSTRPLLYKGRSATGSISFENSTIAANAAAAAGGGGGIYLAAYTYGGVKSGRAAITSTIVSGNSAAGLAQDLARGAGSTSGGFDGAFSLIQTPGSAPILSNHNVIFGVSPQLGALGSHGGPTQTMLPAGTSPVIDQGHAPSSLTRDQRGGPRTINVPGLISPPGGDGTDIGAVELPASSVVVPVAGLSATIHGKLLGGPKTPHLVGKSTKVKCAVRIGTLSSCIIEVRSKSGKLLANGEVTSSHSRTSLTAKVTLTAAGLSALKNHKHGVSAVARVVASTSRSGSQTIAGKVKLVRGSTKRHHGPIALRHGSNTVAARRPVTTFGP